MQNEVFKGGPYCVFVSFYFKFNHDFALDWLSNILTCGYRNFYKNPLDIFKIKAKKSKKSI